MFEKEAEEQAERKISNFIPQQWGVSLIKTEQTYETVEGAPHFYLRSLAEMWKEGAEFGYNKANEWHYVKDGDLPKEIVPPDSTCKGVSDKDNFAFDKLGIPLTEVGEKLHLINETLKDYGILLQRNIGANVEISEVKGEDLATGITITASLFARKKKQEK